MSRWQTFRVPLALALVTLGALVAGLVGTGPWDLAAFVGLAVPLLTIGRYVGRRSPVR